MKSKLVQIVILAFVVGFSASCSLEEPNKTSALKIVIEDHTNNFPNSAMNQFASIGILSNPTSTADFNCFAVNISGPNILPKSSTLSKCSSTTNYNGHGAGIFTQPKSRGQNFEIDMPFGKTRTIDVYGIYPATSECGGTTTSGSGGGYLLGTKSVDLVDTTSITVTVPISYASQSQDITCQGNSNSLTLVPNGSALNGKAFYVSGCVSNSGAVTTAAPTPGTAATEIAAYTGLSTTDGNYSAAECSTISSPSDYEEFVWDLSSLTLASYNTFSVIWTGRLGYHSGACDGTTAPTAGSAGSYIQHLQVWKDTASSWVDIGTGSFNTTTLSSTFSVPANYVVSGTNKLYVRAAADNNLGSQCGTIQTDYMALTLNP